MLVLLTEAQACKGLQDLQSSASVSALLAGRLHGALRSQIPQGAMASRDGLMTNDMLQACLKSAKESYDVEPDIASKFLHCKHTSSPSGKKCSIFAFPGSHNLNDWVVNTRFQQEPASAMGLRLPGHVHAGFARRVMEIFDSDSFRAELARAATARNTIYFTGHSLGGAVAMLATLIFLDRCSAQYSRMLFFAVLLLLQLLV